ncbi:MAG: hypothetical protein IPM37_13375 [Hahellaceae bacterium]|nr:hypothetical protein [Hahellaceae bacterium]
MSHICNPTPNQKYQLTDSVKQRPSALLLSMHILANKEDPHQVTLIEQRCRACGAVSQFVQMPLQMVQDNFPEQPPLAIDVAELLDQFAYEREIKTYNQLREALNDAYGYQLPRGFATNSLLCQVLEFLARQDLKAGRPPRHRLIVVQSTQKPMKPLLKFEFDQGLDEHVEDYPEQCFEYARLKRLERAAREGTRFIEVIAINSNTEALKNSANAEPPDQLRLRIHLFHNGSIVRTPVHGSSDYYGSFVIESDGRLYALNEISGTEQTPGQRPDPSLGYPTNLFEKNMDETTPCLSIWGRDLDGDGEAHYTYQVTSIKPLTQPEILPFRGDAHAASVH